MAESVAFISVGSNIKPRQNIIAALTLLKERVRVRASSTFYRTEPVGGGDQPHFINGVWRVATVLSPAQVKREVLKPIEGKLGRVRADDRFAPRPIDLDLTLYDDLVVSADELMLPHPDIIRPFVQVPILELLDDTSHEIEAKLLTAIRALLPAHGVGTISGEPLADLTDELRRMLT